jgi:hypothetical protein
MVVRKIAAPSQRRSYLFGGAIWVEQFRDAHSATPFAKDSKW